MEIWALIVKSNTFNFLIMVIIMIAVLKGIHIGQLLENAKTKIKEKIDLSSKTKEDSVSKLAKAHAAISNIEDEIEKIFSKNDENIENIKSKIEDETSAALQKIEDNSKKLITLEEDKIFSNLSKQTALASIELAKNHIIKTLEEKPQYHDNFISESINELDEVQYNEK